MAPGLDEHADGGQYVTNADGDKVYGVWFIPPDEPTPTVIVNMQARPLSGGFPYPRPPPYRGNAGRRCEKGRFTTALGAPTVSIRSAPGSSLFPYKPWRRVISYRPAVKPGKAADDDGMVVVGSKSRRLDSSAADQN